MSGEKGPDDRTSAMGDAAADVSVLDQALWSRFREDGDLSDFAQVWLSLVIRRIGGAHEAVVLLEDAAENALTPIANWPPDGRPSDALKGAVEAAMDRGRGVAFGVGVAEPIEIDGDLLGVVAVATDTNRTSPQDVLAQLRWGKGWLQSAIRRQAMTDKALEHAKSAVVLDALGAMIDAGSYKAATHALVNVLARELDCAEVALGEARPKRTRLVAISDIADFKLQTGRSRAVEEAISECTGQAGVVLHPARADTHFMVDLAHRHLAGLAPTGELLTLPVYTNGQVSGGLHLRKPQGDRFADGELLAAEAVAAAVGPLLEKRKKADRGILKVTVDRLGGFLSRLFGSRNTGLKLTAFLLAAIVLFFSFATGSYRLNADAEVEGQVVRSLSAPFDGFVKSETAQAGDVVRKGDIIATLDERDLEIELLRWMNDLGRYQGEYDKALADGDAPAARIADANVAQSRAKAELVEQQLQRSTLIAPFDAIVIEGDLSQSLGSAVRRGEELFRLAPLDAYRVTMEVDETDLDEIATDQVGQLRLAALPDRAFEIEVVRITPRLEAGEGRNFARVEARVTGAPDAIRPGMRGVAKVFVEDRLLIDIYTRPILNWLRLKLWRWMP